MMGETATGAAQDEDEEQEFDLMSFIFRCNSEVQLAIWISTER